MLACMNPQAPNPVPPHERTRETPSKGRDGYRIDAVFAAGIVSRGSAAAAGIRAPIRGVITWLPIGILGLASIGLLFCPVGFPWTLGSRGRMRRLRLALRRQGGRRTRRDDRDDQQNSVHATILQVGSRRVSPRRAYQSSGRNVTIARRPSVCQGSPPPFLPSQSVWKPSRHSTDCTNPAACNSLTSRSRSASTSGPI